MIARRLAAGDTAAWRAFRIEGLQRFPESFATSMAEEQARSDADVTAMLKRRQVIALFEGKTIVATVALDPEAAANAAHRVWLQSMLVAADRQRRGLGRRILASALVRAQSAGFLQAELHVAADNHGARALYEAAGFEICGRVPRAVRLGAGFCDDLHMVRALDDRSRPIEPAAQPV